MAKMSKSTKTKKAALEPKAKPKAKPQAKAAKTAAVKKSAATKSPTEVLEPEIVEPAGHDDLQERLRAELDSMREAGFDPLELDESALANDLTNDLAIELTNDLASDKARLVSAETVSADTSSRAMTAADPVTLYLAELRKYPLLTREQEQELARRYRETGDAKAAELLVTSNLRFVVKIAAEYSRFGAKLIDLIQEGNVGLMHAVKEFNPYKGVRLITYAVWWIRGYIQEYLMRQYSLVRIGTTQNQRKLFYRLQKERDAISHAGQEPSHALIAGRLGVTEEEVETMSKRLSGRDVSLNQPINASGDSTSSLLDFEEVGGTAVDDAIGEREELKVLRENLEKIREGLTEKELYILEQRVLSDEPLTLQEIGDHYKVTREAVRQLEARLIAKIRTAVTSSLVPSPHDE